MKNFANIVKKNLFNTVVSLVTLDFYCRLIRTDIEKSIAQRAPIIAKTVPENNYDLNLSIAVEETNIIKKLEGYGGRKELREKSIEKDFLSELTGQLETKNYKPGNTIESLQTKEKYPNEELNRINNDQLIDNKNQAQDIQEFLNKLNKNDFFDYINQLFEKYQEFLNTLTSDQIVIIFNLIGYFWLINIVTNLTIIIMGDYLIERFNLEKRLPKIAKIIAIRKKINKNILKFNLLSFYIVITFFIIGNVYMFFLKYSI